MLLLALNVCQKLIGSKPSAWGGGKKRKKKKNMGTLNGLKYASGSLFDAHVY